MILSRGLGWLPSVPDLRDRSFVALAAARGWSYEMTVSDLKAFLPPVEDQRATNSCTANAGVALLENFELRKLGRHGDGSRLFLYKKGRELAGISGDNGCYNRSIMKAMARFGVPPEADWPFEERLVDAEPPPELYAKAERHQALEYYRLDTGDQIATLWGIKIALNHGLPVLFGIPVYDSFPTGPGLGDVPYPRASEHMRGGHAMVVTGHEDPAMRFRIRNSWGEAWGDGGYGWLPYSYVTEGLASDIWALVEAETE